MGSIRKKIEDLMSAVSFAEEGEFETAREIMKEERRVLLAVRKGFADRKTFRYAANASRRTDAGLDILYLSLSDGEDPEFEQCIAEIEKEGLEYRVVRKSGCLKQAIIDYTNAMKGILFAVIESAEHLEAECKGKDSTLSETWRNLRCPLVVVADIV